MTYSDDVKARLDALLPQVSPTIGDQFILLHETFVRETQAHADLAAERQLASGNEYTVKLKERTAALVASLAEIDRQLDDLNADPTDIREWLEDLRVELTRLKGLHSSLRSVINDLNAIEQEGLPQVWLTPKT